MSFPAIEGGCNPATRAGTKEVTEDLGGVVSRLEEKGYPDLLCDEGELAVTGRGDAKPPATAPLIERFTTKVRFRNEPVPKLRQLVSGFLVPAKLRRKLPGLSTRWASRSSRRDDPASKRLEGNAQLATTASDCSSSRGIESMRA